MERSHRVSSNAAQPATLLEQVEQLGHYPKRFKKPTTDKERAESSLAVRIALQWSKLDDATKEKMTKLKQSVSPLERLKEPTSDKERAEMHRFISSAASSSSGRAEQPAAASSSCSSAEQPSSSLRTAEQPATPSHFQILSICDVQRWLAVETVASCSSADMERIREAAAVLSRPKPRQKEVRPLQSKWQVARLKDKKNRSLPEVLDEFQGKVIKAAKELQLKLLGVEDPFLPELERANEDTFLAKAPTKKSDRNVVRGATAMCNIQSPTETEQTKRMRYFWQC